MDKGSGVLQSAHICATMPHPCDMIHCATGPSLCALAFQLCAMCSHPYCAMQQQLFPGTVHLVTAVLRHHHLSKGQHLTQSHLDRGGQWPGLFVPRSCALLLMG